VPAGVSVKKKKKKKCEPVAVCHSRETKESPTGSQTQNENAFSEATITDNNCLL
jgi:hypothetical protein